MCNQTYLTEKELEILHYVNLNGGFRVSVSPTMVKQNKNFYNRVKKLENNNLVIVHRFDGFPSELDLTSTGKDYIKSCPAKTKIEKSSDEEFLISLIKASSLSIELKSKVIEVLS